MTLLLKNACYIDPYTFEFTDSDILVRSGTDQDIEFINKQEPKKQVKAEEVLDCKGKYVTKSFAVGHHHVYSALARGMPAPAKTPENFVEILKYIWWQIDKSLDRDTIEASALATAMACAKAGATFVIDHHASPNFIEGSLEIIRKAFERIGISHLLCYEVTDRDGHDKALKGLETTNEYLLSNQGLVGLHASFTVNDVTLKSAVELMNKTGSGIHIHVAEDLADQKHCENNFNMRVIERLDDFGALDSSKTILVHCLHLNKNERKILRNKPVYIAQNMESNLKNNVGYFNSRGLGDRIMLGTDGMHSDMLRSAQAAYFVGQGHDQIDFVSAYQRFRKVHDYIRMNDFKGDGPNNLVVLDYNSPTEMNQDNFLGHFIFGLGSGHIQHVISNGSLIVKDRQLVKIDEQETLAFTRQQSLRLWHKFSK
jgi:cytosine/adenosine deaminase-related metal-dependent hydrolase